jgi:hypothetical protein
MGDAHYVTRHLRDPLTQPCADRMQGHLCVLVKQIRDDTHTLHTKVCLSQTCACVASEPTVAINCIDGLRSSLLFAVRIEYGWKRMLCSRQMARISISQPVLAKHRFWTYSGLCFACIRRHIIVPGAASSYQVPQVGSHRLEHSDKHQGQTAADLHTRSTNIAVDLHAAHQHRD